MFPSAAEISAITRLFSSTVYRELARRGRSPLFRRLIEQTTLEILRDSQANVGDIFDPAFNRLNESGHRNEYIYRAALTKKILLGRHSLRTASMLSEFRVGSCKADLVILNGTSEAYEIKSERDTLARLANQVMSYKRAFAKVNVIASDDQIDSIRSSIPDDVGILCLTNRYQISVVRDAFEQPDRICPLTVFDSLRSDEAATILKAFGVPIPQVPNTRLRSTMRALFSNLDSAALHNQMVTTLKNSRSLAPLADLTNQLPASLHAAALSIPLRHTDQGRLVQTLKLPLKSTMAWA